MMKKFGRVVAVLCALGATPAMAAVTIYTDQTAFEAAVSSAAVHDFTGLVPDAGYAVLSPTVAGVTFSDASLPFVIGDQYNTTYGTAFFSGQNASQTAVNDVTISLSGYGAFGFNYGSYIASSDAYTVTLNTGDMIDLVTAPTTGTLQFLGFVSDGAPITSIDLLDKAVGTPGDGYGFALDVTTFVTANPLGTPAPEPASWALMILGFGMIGGALRTSRKHGVRPGIA